MAADVESYRFRAGDFECAALGDGSVNYPPGHLFANALRVEVEEALRQRGLPVDYVTTPCTHLYVDTGAHRLLVDTGAGALAPSTGRLPRSLEAAGVEPAAIDTVILTHAHPAHVGGMLDEQGRPVYGSAHYALLREEWEFWTSEVAFSKASERHVAIARRNLEAVRDRLTLLDRASEIVPGVRVIPAAGHTPGHAVVSVSSAGARLLYISDTVYHPLHLGHPDWLPIFDILPGQAAASKRRVLDWAAEEQALVMGHHFPPFPSLGRVVKHGEGWQWRICEMTE
jgi:glyoxylase-like metal-dependent hydrolase (beta-lactamase superfamily II)